MTWSLKFFQTTQNDLWDPPTYEGPKHQFSAPRIQKPEVLEKSSVTGDFGRDPNLSYKSANPRFTSFQLVYSNHLMTKTPVSEALKFNFALRFHLNNH